jgi:hypothetical protein
VRDIREEVLIRDNNRVIVSDIFKLHEKQTQVAESLRLAVKLSALPDVCNSFFFLKSKD